MAHLRGQHHEESTEVLSEGITWEMTTWKIIEIPTSSRGVEDLEYPKINGKDCEGRMYHFGFYNSVVECSDIIESSPMMSHLRPRALRTVRQSQDLRQHLISRKREDGFAVRKQQLPKNSGKMQMEYVLNFRIS